MILALRYFVKSETDPPTSNPKIAKQIILNKYLSGDFTKTNKWLVEESQAWIQKMEAEHPNFKIENLVSLDEKTKAFEYKDPDSGYSYKIEADPFNYIKQSNNLDSYSCLSIDNGNASRLFGNAGNINMQLAMIYDKDGNLSQRQLVAINPQMISMKPSYIYHNGGDAVSDEISARFLKAYADHLGLDIVTDKGLKIISDQHISNTAVSFHDSRPYHDGDIIQFPSKNYKHVL